ncbi:MAG: translation initiation factor IF-5A [Euryarchaeota archaeon]|nr:translation initiation factor IF-5A [Euryarchaeota archaeon]
MSRINDSAQGHFPNADKASIRHRHVPGTTRAEIRTLKVGRYVAIDNDAYKILSMSKSKPGKHGSAKARIELEDIFTGQKKSHVGTVTDTINIPLIEKGSAIITHIQGNEVHAMDNKTYETLILPKEPEMNLEAGGEIQWMEAMGRYKISRDH